MTEPFGGAVT
jgi:hypothetical protein